jgi:cysteine sulfinate desulfinase/cysteine desulfurase-like protein
MPSRQVLPLRSGDFTSPSPRDREPKPADVKSPLHGQGICASFGSACLADSNEPSQVIKAKKPDSTASRQMIRFSVDVEHSSATTKTVLAILEASKSFLMTPMR